MQGMIGRQCSKSRVLAAQHGTTSGGVGAQPSRLLKDEVSGRFAPKGHRSGKTALNFVRHMGSIPNSAVKEIRLGETTRGGNASGMQHQHRHRGNWQATYRAPDASATLRPPKRHGEDDVTPSASPKRYCPSPSPSPDPNWLNPGPQSGSESDVCTDAASPLPPPFTLNSTFPRDRYGETSDARSNFFPTHSAQDDLGSMDWVPTHTTPVHDDTTHSDPIICYGAVSSSLFSFHLRDASD